MVLDIYSSRARVYACVRACVCVPGFFHPGLCYKYTPYISATVHAVYDISVLIGSESSKGSSDSAPMFKHTRAFDARIYEVWL